MRSRLAAVMIAVVLANDSVAQVALKGPVRRLAPVLDDAPVPIPLLRPVLDTLGTQAVRITGTVEYSSTSNGAITLKLVNRIAGSDSAAVYVVAPANRGDVANLSRFQAEDIVNVSGVVRRRAPASGQTPTFFMIPHSPVDVTSIGWTHLARERLEFVSVAVIAVVLLIAVPFRTRNTVLAKEPMHLETAGIAAPAHSRSTARTTTRVLLIEDEPLVRLAARRGLERNGFDVEEASSGSDAMALWRTSPEAFDCVVSDVVLPGALGPDVVERMRTDRSELPVLYVSGHAKWLTAMALEEPHTAFLQKPFGSKQLNDALSALLNPAPFAA